VSEELQLRQVRYEHPDVAALEAEAQQFYIEIYGGPDETPYATADFSPPDGAFFVGYLDDEAVAMGGWRFRTPGVPPMARRPAEIRRMFVQERVRGRGYARIILTALETSAAAAAPIGCFWRPVSRRSPRLLSTDQAATSMLSGSGTTRTLRPRSTWAGR
jgi:GNAT superfamily N-acetyltransferase